MKTKISALVFIALFSLILLPQNTFAFFGDPVNDAVCLSISAPQAVTAGQTFNATVSMRNTGTSVWNNNGWANNSYLLGSQNPQDNQRWGLGRVDLPVSSLSPNQTVTFSFAATAPSIPGTYPFDWRMVEEQIQWFGQTCTKTITVNPTAPQGSAPIVLTNSAININQNSAVFNGQVNPNNAQTTFWFEYGNSYSLGQTVGNQSIGSGSASQNVSYTVFNLNSNATYYYRPVAQNQYGTTQGQILSFTTQNNGGGGCTYNCNGSSPIATTNYVSGISQNSATLNGTINPNSSNTNYWFEYGQTSGLGQTTGFQFLGSGYGGQNVSAYLYNLVPNMNYYYRLVAQNQYGTAYGSIYSFTTTSNGGNWCGGGGYYNGQYNPPCVQTLTPSGIGDTYATFVGQVNSQSGDSIAAWFEYGINNYSFTHTTNNSFIPSYASNYNFSNSVSGLTPGTAYYVRAVARNSYGTSYGQSYQFSTTGSNDYGTAPSALTKPATFISQNSALLNGSVNPAGSVGNGWFEYGPTLSFGLKTLAQPIGSGNDFIGLAFALSGLLPNNTYYFRAVAQTPSGTAYGSILSFNTANTPIVLPPINNGTTTIITNIINSSCLKLSPALDKTEINGGDNVLYSITYKNDCGYNLSNASLKVVLPLEAQFVSTNNAIAAKDSNTVSYNLGRIQDGYQGTLEINNTVSESVNRGNTLIYGATLNWNDKRGRFNSEASYIAALVAGGRVAGLASILNIFGGWGWLWLLLILFILFFVYWIFFRKEEKTAVQKIQQTLT